MRSIVDIALMSALVRSCSESLVTRSRLVLVVRRPPCRIARCRRSCASTGFMSGSMYSTETCGRRVGVGLEARAEPLEVGLLVEHGELDRRVEALQDLDASARPGCSAGWRSGPTACSAAPRGNSPRPTIASATSTPTVAMRAVARLALAEVGDDLAPLAERVEHDAGRGRPMPPSLRRCPTPA